MKHLTPVNALALLILGVAGYAYLRRADLGSAVDPSSTNNFIYRAVNQVGDILDDGNDDNSFNLGNSIYNTIGDYREWFN